MRYFLAIVLPPIAVLLCGKPFSAILNLILCCLGWIPGIIHALFVVKSHKEESALKRIERSIIGSARVAHKDAVNLSSQLRNH
ncbi:MAG: YqaE/Pmp3 family membrane protein [Alicyclobacillus sp.]|nr:YqaE/Pmp3 family membrane protein [Alicyclobacillus sp.]